MKKFVVASKNQGKLKEIREILQGLDLEVISMEDAGITEDIAETGTTFEENAMIKAVEVMKLAGEIVMSDDSGLEVDFLNGAPGVYSARFAGEGASDEERNQKLLGLLDGIPMEKRSARFVCVIAVAFPDGRRLAVRGTCEGYIGFLPQGENGFGYDPLFYVPEYGMTTAQMPTEQKHSISHRGKALRMMVEELKKLDV